MDTTQTRSTPRSKAVPLEATDYSLPLTAVVLAPHWRLGRRGATRKAVAASVDAVRPWVRRAAVACHAAAAPSLREAGLDDLLIVPAAATTLGIVAAAMESCPDDPLLLVEAGQRPAQALLARLHDSLQDEGAAAAALLVSGVPCLPLLCRQSVRPILAAAAFAGQGSLEDLLRKPWARLILVE